MEGEKVAAWAAHLAGCGRCQAVVARGEGALMFNLCTAGRVLYYPAWQESGHQRDGGAKKAGGGPGGG